MDTATEVRQFEYTQRDFERVRRMIHARAGISLGPSKLNMVYSRLSRRLRAVGLGSVRSYLDGLEDNEATPEWEAFTNALTTNLTSFFREAHHFATLRDHLQRRTATDPARPARIWCAAASTGEEPYSIAMTAVDAFGSFTPPVSILATDVDTQVLATGRAGVYPMERVEALDRGLQRRFFRRGTGAREGSVCVAGELAALVRFEPLNLLDARWPIRAPLDAIFCRNVMIYFDEATRRELLCRFAPLLAPDGLLFMGHSESLLRASDLFRPCGRTVYRLAGAAS
ncbi:MAG: CheR family methyltransferase [Gammaproteobacteria bacterium]